MARFFPTKRQTLVLFLALLIAVGVFLFAVNRANAPSQTAQNANVSDHAQPAAAKDDGGFNKNKFSLEDPASIWVVTNKKRPLPDGYAPSDLDGSLRREPAAQLKLMLDAAAASGFPLHVISGFRSQQNQTQTYNGYVSRDGHSKADTYSARPRHSEHQTGLAADLANGTCDLEICFGNTPAGKWLASRAHEYGFIIRYVAGKESITGYQAEPWHLRYVGTDLALQLFNNDQTMEEFFNLHPAPNY